MVSRQLVSRSDPPVETQFVAISGPAGQISVAGATLTISSLPRWRPYVAEVVWTLAPRRGHGR